MRGAPSLRSRLFVLILSPLVLMALLLGYWRYSVAQDTAQELYDRSLMSAALAISRDVAVSGGDSLSVSTRDLIRDTSGGEVFYHATGPGGIYVTGYAYPPASPPAAQADRYVPRYFEALYREEPVRVLSMTERVTFETMTGDATVTVWQRLSDREAFAAGLAARAFGLIAALLITLALVVWFGVQRGLRPLTELQDAIAARSPDDLSRIQRAVPVETQGILKTLNRLFDQIESSMNAYQVFISDAAHQLRNPTAAVKSMAEALRDARTEKDREIRMAALTDAVNDSVRVADQLLSLDRLQHSKAGERAEDLDLNALTEDICAAIGASILSRDVEFELRAAPQLLPVRGDKVFIGEAIKNLIDNALKHGGPDLRSICVETAQEDDFASVTVSDDGRDLSPADAVKVFSRFGQKEPTSGSGLGLAIAVSVAEHHGGNLRINEVESGASLTLLLPLVPVTSAAGRCQRKLG